MKISSNMAKIQIFRCLNSCWQINRWKSSDFQAVYICEAKIFTKKDMMLLFFSSESWHVAFFNSDIGWTLGWTPGRQFYFEILRFYDFWRIWHVISKLNRRPDVHPSVHPTSELKKATCQLSLEKKINLVSFFVNFSAQSDFRGWFFGTTVEPPFFIKITNFMIFWFFQTLNV